MKKSSLVLRCNIYRVISIVLLLFVLGVFPVESNAEATYIRVGTFNIANFGATNEYERSLINLVNIIVKMNADLIAVQEVQPNELGYEQVVRLTALLNKAAVFYGTNPYENIIPEDHTGDEQTAFLWRAPVSLESEVTLLEHDSDPDGDEIPTFQRVPHVALFQAGNYDFYVVNCHLYTKLTGVSSEGRGAEYDALVAWLQDLANEQEKDAIVLGDFNRFLYGKGDWDRLMITNHSNFFRFPLLEAIKNAISTFDPMKHDAPSDTYSTTTSKSKRIYDQILISQGSYSEFTSSPQWDSDIGIVVFDNDSAFEWFIDSWQNAIKMLSYHRPVWIRIRTDLQDDD